MCQNTVDVVKYADFEVLNNGAPVGTPINFRNLSTTGASYLWTFGDGNFSTLIDPSHTYSAAGTYTVMLKVTLGSATSSHIVTVDVVSL